MYLQNRPAAAHLHEGVFRLDRGIEREVVGRGSEAEVFGL
jgi:hypothetical protein